MNFLLAPAEDEPLELLTLDQLLALEFPDAPAWIGSKLLVKGGKLLVGGPPKIGKTFISLEIGRAIASGDNLFGCPLFPCEKGRVLLVDMEVGAREMQGRVSLSLASEMAQIEGRLGFACKDPYIQIDTSEGLKRLAQYVDAFQPNVIILDPLASLHTSNEDNNTDMRRIFSAVSKMQDYFSAHDLSVVIVHHFTKEPRKKEDWDPLAMSNFRGAGALYGWVDAAMSFTRVQGQLGIQGRGWRLKSRVGLRHDAQPDDLFLTVNEAGDLRVRWNGDNKPPQPTVNPEPMRIKADRPRIF